MSGRALSPAAFCSDLESADAEHLGPRLRLAAVCLLAAGLGAGLGLLVWRAVRRSRRLPPSPERVRLALRPSSGSSPQRRRTYTSGRRWGRS